MRIGMPRPVIARARWTTPAGFSTATACPPEAAWTCSRARKARPVALRKVTAVRSTDTAHGEREVTRFRMSPNSGASLKSMSPNRATLTARAVAA
jgi:hypothetical protein